jgi:hypothetical protein
MSSSCNATAPIDISTNASTNPIKVGSFICSYDPDLCTGAAVSMSEDRVYLTIKCNSSNDSKVVFYGGGSFIPTEIRIYAPSLHTYNGSHTDAEMLIVHSPGSSNSSNSGSSGLIVSVPISISSNGPSADMSAILQAANTINPGTLSVNSSAPINEDINVNDLIPAKPYYVYYGTLPYDSCGGNYYYAVFTDTISAVGPISNLVASGIATVPMASKTNLQKSNGPPTTGSGDGDDGQAEEYVLYQVVDDESCPDTKPKGKTTTADDSTGKSFGINAIFGIVIAALIVGVAYLFWNWNVVKTAAATAVAGSSAPAPSVPPPLEESGSNSGNMSTGQLIFVLMISIIGCTFVAYVNGTMLYKANK